MLVIVRLQKLYCTTQIYQKLNTFSVIKKMKYKKCEKNAMTMQRNE